MLAYHNNPAVKAQLVASLTEHTAHDRIVQGHYWENGKGCAVACTLESFDKTAASEGRHSAYESVLGIPQALARLEDRIFEGLTNGTAKEWPLRFANAIQPGADLTMVVPRLLFWILSERLPLHVNKDKYPKVWQGIADIAALYREWCEGGTKPSSERFAEARAKVRSADAYDAYAAAAYAYAAAAYADADAAAAAADADAAAAYAADADAADAYAAGRSRAKARSLEFEKIADKLVELLASAPQGKAS